MRSKRKKKILVPSIMLQKSQMLWIAMQIVFCTKSNPCSHFS